MTYRKWKNRLIIPFILVLLLAVTSLPFIPVGAQEPVVYRGENYIDTDFGNGTHAWQSASQWVFDGSEWVSYIFEETGGYYQVQSGLIGARIYKSGYAEFWSPDMTEVRLYEETWEVQYWSGSKWSVCDTYSPEFTVSSDGSTVNITASFTTDWPNSGERAFTVKYIFREGRPLKHEVDFTSYASEEYEFRVAQKWAGIVAAKVRHDEGEDVVTSVMTLNGSQFRFLKENDDLSIYENQWQMYYGYDDVTGDYYVLENQNLKPVEIDLHAQGLKADFIFGDWTLAQGEILEIDPTLLTLDDTTIAGWVDGSDSNNKEVWPATPEVHYGEGGDVDDIGFVEWSVSGIPDSADVLDSDIVVHCSCHDDQGGDPMRTDMRHLYENQPLTATGSAIKSEYYGAPWIIENSFWPPVGTQQSVDLGSAGDSAIESRLVANWFAIGLHISEAKFNQNIDFWLKEWSGPPDPAPTLKVRYTLSPTITSASISDRDDGDNVYSMKKYYSFVAVVNDPQGATDIAGVYLRGKNGAGVLWEVRATSLTGTPAWSIYSGSTIIDLDTGSCSWAENGNQGTATFKIRTEWDHGALADLELAVYVVDSEGAYAGWTDMQTNYWDAINRLVTTSFAVADGRINRGTSETFSGNVWYATTISGNTASSSYPPNAQFTAVRIHDSGHTVRGSDTSISNGAFSLAFNIPDAVQNNVYHVYLDMVADYSDADAPDGDTVATIGDQFDISVTFNDSRANLNVGIEVRYEIEYSYDLVPFTGSDGSIVGYTWDGTNSWWEDEFTAPSSPGSVNYDENDLGAITDNNYGLTALEDDAGADCIGDRWKLLSFWTSDENPKTGQTVYLYATAELEYDGHDPDGDDALIIENVEFTWDWEEERFYVTVNKSTAGSITYDDLTSIIEDTYNITLGTMSGLSVTVTWGDFEYHFYGLYNENGSFIGPVDLSAHMATDTDVFEVDGYLHKYFTEEPMMFSFSLSGGGNRYIYQYADNETIYLFTPDGTTGIYSFAIKDFTGKVGSSNSFLESLRAINGTELMVERQLIWDTANTVPLTLVQTKIYMLQVRFADGSLHKFGYWIPGAESTPTLSIYGIDFSDKAHLAAESIIVEAVRPADEHIRLNYKDNIEDTDMVYVSVCLLNGTEVWSDSASGDLLQFNWYGANNVTDYRVDVLIVHNFYGNCTYTGWLAAVLDSFYSAPDLELFGTWPIQDAFAVFLIIATACIFSRGSSVIGLGVTIFVAATLTGLGMIDISYTILASSFALVVMWGLSGGGK